MRKEQHGGKHWHQNIFILRQEGSEDGQGKDPL